MKFANKQNWLDLWNRIDARGNGEKVFNYLLKKYNEDGRYYHTFEHISHCLEEFERIRDLTKHTDALEFALWFHDVIYNTRLKDNEEQSAATALKVIQDASLPNTFGKLVENFILATEHNKSFLYSDDIDIKLIIDIDLSILGSNEEEFDSYEEKIRKEYNWVPEKEFSLGRIKILKSFLNRDKIYSTEQFQDLYEHQARENIKRSINKLELY